MSIFQARHMDALAKAVASVPYTDYYDTCKAAIQEMLEADNPGFKVSKWNAACEKYRSQRYK